MRTCTHITNSTNTTVQHYSYHRSKATLLCGRVAGVDVSCEAVLHRMGWSRVAQVTTLRMRAARF